MAGIGIGIGLGLSGGRRANKPPNPDDIIRRFKTQEDNILIDSISSNDGDKILPVSVFNGVDGEVLYNDFTNSETVSGTVFCTLSNSPTHNTIISISSGSGTLSDMVLDILGNNLRFFGTSSAGNIIGDASGVDISLYFDNEIHNVAFFVTPSSMIVNIDDVEIINSTLSEGINSDDNRPFVIGGRNGLRYYTGSIYSVIVNDILIPLPHLPYGFDSSNNPISLTVSGGVSLGYDINGSSYLQDKGVVERNPELVPESYWLNSYNWLLDTTSSLNVSEKYVEIINDSSTFNKARLSINLIPNTKFTFIIEVLENTSSVAPILIRDVGFLDSQLVIPPFEIGIYSFTATTLSDITVPYLYTFLTNNGISGELIKYRIVSITLAAPEIIPNTPTGQPAYPIVSGDTLISGGGMMNLTDCLVRLYEIGDTDPAKLFFNKSDRLIWKTGTGGDWHTSELEQQAIYDNIQDAYKYKLWSKVNSSGIFKDVFLYANQLVGNDICKAKNYVGVGETYSVAESELAACKLDKIE